MKIYFLRFTAFFQFDINENRFVILFPRFSCFGIFFLLYLILCTTEDPYGGALKFSMLKGIFQYFCLWKFFRTIRVVKNFSNLSISNMRATRATTSNDIKSKNQ